jgi:predicted nucleotidyltransferase
MHMEQLIDRLKTKNAIDLFVRNDVVLAYVFGSQARGEAGPLSDVDVAILFAADASRQDRFERVLVMSNALGVMVQREDVDVIDLQEASPLLRHRVYYDGHLLYCPDDAVRVRFETTALRDYVDTAPLRRLKEKFLYQRFVKGVD